MKYFLTFALIPFLCLASDNNKQRVVLLSGSLFSPTFTNNPQSPTTLAEENAKKLEKKEAKQKKSKNNSNNNKICCIS